MTAINFPDSPSDGDTHVVGGVTYTYNNAETKWKTTINSNAFLPLTGGTLSGNLTLGSNQLTAGGLTYPTSDGTTGQYLQTDGAGALSFQTVSSDYLTWERATLAGPFTTETSHTWSNLSNVKEVKVLVNAVDQNGTNGQFGFRLGTGGTLQSSGYKDYRRWEYSAGSWNLDEQDNATEFSIEEPFIQSRDDITGIATFSNITGNQWMFQFEAFVDLDTSTMFMMRNIGVVTLSGALNDVGILTTAGSWNGGTAQLIYLTQP